MGLQTDVGRLPGGLGSEVLGHVGLRAAGLLRVEQRAGLETHQVGRLDLDQGLGDRELHPLVHADRPVENDALAGVARRAIDEPVAITDAFCGDQGPFGIESVEQVAEALALVTDQVLCGDFEIIEEQFVGLVVDHVGDRSHRETVADGVMQVDDEDRHPFGFPFHLGERCGACQQDHQIRVLHARNPDLLTIDQITAILPFGGSPDLRRIGTGARLGHRHRLDAEFPGGNRRQVFFLLRRAAVPQQRTHVIHLAMHGAGIATATVDLFHDHARRGQPQAGAAVLLGNHCRQPASTDQRGGEGLGISALLVDPAEILVREVAAEVADGVANLLVIVIGTEHCALLAMKSACGCLPLECLPGTLYTKHAETITRALLDVELARTIASSRFEMIRRFRIVIAGIAARSSASFPWSPPHELR
ncbi:MAG: hypothetical protein AW09_004570 [Candidatus Accumulibacter phosphatis]|uniref:Uncharacterized protein n=1 Tax=Candidatus Accumulibacter phosphatis TaxID=327160 RepID=A0A084Y6K0_9PROT|nr:MAG: hypothetical protein AW09_004570 [Candidatus Accumulibacter phosphatis]